MKLWIHSQVPFCYEFVCFLHDFMSLLWLLWLPPTIQ